MLKARRILRWYEQGRITEFEMLFQMAQSLSDRNVRWFLAWATPELLEKMREHLHTCPKSDEGWSRFRVLYAGGWTGPVTTYETQQQEELRLHRCGVEVLRDSLEPRSWKGLGERWRCESVARIARGIRQKRAFEALPVLADAAEEAGITDVELLFHLRHPDLTVEAVGL